MMLSRLRQFQLGDRTLADSLHEPAKRCVRLLHDRGSKLFIAEPNYADQVWADRSLQVADPNIKLARPIGIVLQGALEVTERFVYGSTVRRRTTAILRKGDFFGLFEVFGGLEGFWEITAGVQRFLISCPLGNAIMLKRRGWKDVGNSQLLTLQHRRDADYDYSDFIRYAFSQPNRHQNEVSEWQCQIVLFDFEKINDPEVEALLLRAVVAQLASLARQNPPDALFEESGRTKHTAEHLRVSATLDAILADHIPVFGAYTSEHEVYGPFTHLLESLRALRIHNCPNETCSRPIEFWVPEYWSRIKSAGALYLDALAGKFDMTAADELLNVGGRDLVLPSGTRIAKVAAGNNEKYSVRVTTTADGEAVIHGVAIQRKTRRLPTPLNVVLFPASSCEELKYAWPLHLAKGFFLRRHHDCTRSGR